MERKTVHALLLSLAVVAGGVMMTNDAYAQTNTERLMTTVDNTNSIISALSALADAVTNGFAEVLEAIGMVQADTSTIMTKIGNVESELGTVHSEVEAIHGEVDGMSTEVEAIHSEVDGISGDLANLESSLNNISNDLASLSGAVGTSTASFTTLAENVQANQVAINSLSEKLDVISNTVGAVQTTVNKTQAEAEEPAVRNMLHTAETEQTVAVADFAGTVTKHPTDNVYEASNTFSCTGDVFIDDMSVSKVNDALSSNQDTTGSTAKSTITVEGFFLYEATNVGTAASPNHVDITKTREFDNRFLRAGDGLVIKGSTDQSQIVADDGNVVALDTRADGNHNRLNYNNGTTGAPEFYFSIQDYVALKSNKATIGPGNNQAGANAGQNATKANLGTVELYTITVNWFAASSDTTCSISSAVETASGLPNTDKTVLVALNLDEASTEGPPTPFIPATIDCNGEDTEITNVSIQAGALRGLNQFIEVELTAGGEPASVSFGDDNAADDDASDLPFRFSGSDVTVSGEGIGTLLLQVTYDTTQGNTCKTTSN